MAEFVEVIKQKKRMCETFKICDKCGLYDCNNGKFSTCDNFTLKFPQEAEEIIMKWAKEHPVKTNADRFKEVFGFSPNKNSCPFNIESCGCGCDESNCNHYNFWKQEYKEPK